MFTEETGYGLAKWIVENQLQKQANFIIHSMNPVGGNRILNILRDNEYQAERFPFYLMLLEDKLQK